MVHKSGRQFLEMDVKDIRTSPQDDPKDVFCFVGGTNSNFVKQFLIIKFHCVRVLGNQVMRVVVLVMTRITMHKGNDN